VEGNKMVRRATLGVFSMLLILVCVGFIPVASAQTATPSQAVITVSGIPAGTKAFAVEVTVDTTILKLGGVSSDSGGVSFSDGSSKGVGTFSDMDLPATVKLTVDLTGVAVGMSGFAVGNVLDMLGSDGVAVAGAMAAVDVSSVAVASSSTTTSSTSSTSSTGGSGMLSADTITVTIDGQALNSTNAVNVTLAFGTDGVATVDTTGLTFMGAGATQLLTEVMGNVLTAAWDGSITDSKAVLTAMLKAGTVSGTTTISVSKVEVAGGTDVTSSVAASVSPSSVTNSGGGTSTSGGTFTLLPPTSVTAPGRAAVAFTASGVTKKQAETATLNGSPVKFFNSNLVGIAIIKIGGDITNNTLPLTLKIGMSTVDLGNLTVVQGSGRKPTVSTALARNKSTGTTLTLRGNTLNLEGGTTVLIVPTTVRTPEQKILKSMLIELAFPVSECIPKGSFVNVITAGGTSAKKVKARGLCANMLVQ
jgi:hypothetical protein